MDVDPFKWLKGQWVRVTGAEALKSYEGIVKEVQNNGIAVVEIQARLLASKRLEPVKLANLAILR